MPDSPVVLLGADPAGRQALASALAQHLSATPLRAIEVEDARALSSIGTPALVLLLAPLDAAGEAEDLRWRARLAQAGIGYSVLHGQTKARLDAALALLRPLLGMPAAQAAAPPTPTRWAWTCEKCSDPSCEHRLFQDLLASRRAGN